MSSFLRISLVGFLVFLLGTGVLFAQSDSRENPTNEEPKYKVYIPVDEKGEPQGDKNYISSGLRNELRKASQQRQSLQNRWSILEAKYQATFSVVSTASTQGIVVSQFKATFEIELESATGDLINTTLVLPALPIQVDGAKWDKQPIQPVFVSKNGEKTADANVPRATGGGGSGTTPPGTSEGNPDNVPVTPQPGSQVPPHKGEMNDAEQLIFSLEHQTPGKHTLELMLAPIVEQAGTTGRRIALPQIPKVTDAVLELNLSPDMPSVHAEEALGPTSLAPGSTITKLGPIDKLTLTWNDPFAQANQPRIECEQFFLLYARLNQISVSALYKFRITGGKVQKLEIAADERMTSVGSPIFEENSNAVLLSSASDPLSPGITQLSFKEPISGPLTLRVNYVITNFSGIGVLRFPQIPRSQHPVAKSWLGITSVPTLDLTLPPAPDPKPSTDQFKLDWGEEINEILLATYDLSAADQGWSVLIRTKEPDVEGKLRHSILFRNNRANHSIDTQLDSNGPVYTYAFTIPEDFSVEKVDARVSDSLNQDSYPVSIHWRLRTTEIPAPEESPDASSRQKRKILSIFFERPVRGKHEISFRAFCPFRIDTSEPIPSVELNHVKLSEYSVDLFREKSVVLKDKEISPDWSSVELTEAPKEPFSGIHFGRWIITGHSQTVSPAEESRIVLTANIPLVVGQQYTYLNRNVTLERFNVESRFELDIQEGELNFLRLRYDKLCALPTSFEPAMNIEETVEEGQRFLLLTPHQPLHGKRTIRIRSVMNSSLDSTVFPRIDLTEPFQIKRYVILPSDVKAQPIKWEKNQLAPVSPEESKAIIDQMSLIPATNRDPEGKSTTSFSVSDVLENRQREESLQTANAVSAESSTAATSTMPHTSEKFEVFYVLGPDFSAYINQTENIPTVQLNDVHLFLRQNGTISGVSSFDIRGEGTDHCVLYLPEPYELVSITSGGLTTKGIPVSARRWRFDIWSSQFPQRVEIVFSGSLAGHGDFENPQTDQSPTKTKNSWARVLSPLTKTSSNLPDDNVLPLFRSQGLASLRIALPRLEATNVLGTVWTLAVENSPLAQQTLFYVDQEQNDDWDPRKLLLQGKPSWSWKTEDENKSSSNSKKKEERTAISLLSSRDSVSCVLQVNLIRLANMEALMGGVTGPGSASAMQNEDLLNWHSLWGRKWWDVHREINTQLLVYKSNPGIAWKDTLFHIGDRFPEYMRRVVVATQKPEELFQEISNNYNTSVSRTLPSQSQEMENDMNESSVFAAYRISRSENIAYLFGISSREDLSLQIYSVPKRPGILAALFENETIRITSIVIFIFALLLLTNRLHPRRFFRQYPYFVGNVVAILLWLFFPPGFVGLTMLPILWFAMLWSTWKRRTKRSDIWQVEPK